MTALLLVGVLPGIFSSVTADIEPNDTFVLAEVLAPGTPMNGQLSGTDTDDHYSFTVINGQIISALLSGVDGDDVWGYLYDPQQNQLASTDYIAAGTSETVEYTSNQAITGTYYYLVQGGVSNYTLTVTITDQDDAGSGMDVGDDLQDTYPVTAGFSGWIADGDVADCYQFEVTTAQMLAVTMTTGTTGTDDLWFYVYNPSKDSIGSSDYLNPGVSETFKWTTSFATQGTYYIEVEGGNNDYTIVLAIDDQNDAGQGIDAADDNTAPTLADFDNEYEGWIADDDQADWYGFTVIDGQKIIFTMKTGIIGTDDLWAYIYGPDKETIASTDYLNPDVSETIEYTTSYATAGLYYVEIEGGDNNYFFSFSVEGQDDALSGVDANDTPASALRINDGTDFPGWLADDDYDDFYKIDIYNGQILNVSFTTGTETSEDLWMDILDREKNRLMGTDYLNPDVTGTLSYTTSIESLGFYYLKATGGVNSYKFTVETIDQDDASSGKDAAEALTGSLTVAEGAHSGWVADADKADSYNFTVNAGNVFTVNLTTGGTSGSVVLEAYDTQKNSLGTITAAAGATQSYILPLDKAPATNSLFFIQVRGDGNDYTFDLTLPTTPPDTTPPAVDILTPLNGLVYKAPKVIVTGTATDDGTVTLVQVSLDNSTFINCTGEGAWTCEIDLALGANKVTVRAKDKGGNYGYDDITLQLDTSAPTVSLTSLTNGTKVKKSVAVLTGTAADNIGLAIVEVSVNGGAWQAAVGTGTWALNISLEKGENTIKVRVTDTAGNTVEESIMITYKKDKKESPGFEAVIFVAAIAVAVVALFNRKR